jgi:hypothetical protein
MAHGLAMLSNLTCQRVPGTTAAKHALATYAPHFASSQHDLDTALQLLHVKPPQHHGAVSNQRCAAAHGLRAQLSQASASKALDRK